MVSRCVYLADHSVAGPPPPSPSLASAYVGDLAARVSPFPPPADNRLGITFCGRATSVGRTHDMGLPGAWLLSLQAPRVWLMSGRLLRSACTFRPPSGPGHHQHDTDGLWSVKAVRWAPCLSHSLHGAAFDHVGLKQPGPIFSGSRPKRISQDGRKLLLGRVFGHSRGSAHSLVAGRRPPLAKTAPQINSAACLQNISQASSAPIPWRACRTRCSTTRTRQC